MASFPNRSPLVVAEYLAPIITGRSVCDIGCHDGDLMEAFKRYAKSVCGIELPGALATRAMLRDLDVVVGDVLETDPPKADVYYLWNQIAVRDAMIASLRGIIVLGRRQGDRDFPKMKRAIQFCFTFTEGTMTDQFYLMIFYAPQQYPMATGSEKETSQ